MRALAGDSLPSSERSAKALEPKPAAAATEPSTPTVEAEAAEAEAAPESERRSAAATEPSAAAEQSPAAEPWAGAGPSAGAEPAAAADVPHPRRIPAPPHVVIIGGGAVGGALAHDLVLRGLRVTVLEKGELTSGATGRSLGLLHSGARYATTNRRLAIECVAENKLLRRLAPGTFEENDGLYVAVTDEDADFAVEFLEACWQAAVPTRRLTREQAVRAEPGLNPQLKMAVQVPDATMDSMRLPLRFFATARRNGADIRHFAEVVAVGFASGHVTGVRVRDRATDREYELGADLVVNAAGPWASRVAALAGVRLDASIASGVMAAVRGRHAHLAVSRLHPPGDSDTLLPDRGSTILGTVRSAANEIRERTPEPIAADAIEELRRLGALLVPAIAAAPLRARWVALQSAGRGGRLEVDEPIVVDHAKGRHRLEGFVTVTGGPATIARSTAQAAGDLICRRLGVDRPCATADTPLLPHTAWYAR